MTMTPVGLILDTVPLIALLLLSVLWMAQRRRRELKSDERSGWLASEPWADDCATVPVTRGDFSRFETRVPANGADCEEAWNTLQGRFLSLVEKNERGELPAGGRTGLSELKNAVADYEEVCRDMRSR